MNNITHTDFGIIAIVICVLLAPVAIVVFLFGIATTIAFLRGRFPRTPVAVFWSIVFVSSLLQLMDNEVPFGLGIYIAATLPMAIMFWYYDRRMDMEKLRAYEEEQVKKIFNLHKNQDQ